MRLSLTRRFGREVLKKEVTVCRHLQLKEN